MPQGLEVYGPDGATYISVTSRLGRVLGQVTVSSSGSLVDSRFAQGQPFFMLVGGGGGNAFYYPFVSISGTTLSWTFTPPPANSSPGTEAGATPSPATTTIMYGVY
jgi:hypothetical protein